MKVLIAIFVITLIITLPLAAKNFETIVDDTLGTGLPGQEIPIPGVIKNLTSHEIKIEIRRNTNDIPTTWTSSLCLRLCSAPWIDTVEGAIAANDSLKFSIHFFTDAAPNEGQAQVVINEVKGKLADADTFLFKAKTMDGSDVKARTAQCYACQLLGNYPNPFNNSTIIRFQSEQAVLKVQLHVYSSRGQLVAEYLLTNLSAGEAQFNITGRDMNGTELPSGVYFYRLVTTTPTGKSFTGSGRFTLLK